MKQNVWHRVREHWGLVIILLAFLTLASIYSVATPIFEASDELWHYPVIKHIADGKGLPIQDTTVETLWQQEGSQPPLYYTLMALCTRWINTEDMETHLWYNPHARIGIPGASDNKNMVIHTPAERFPWHGTVLAVHVIRVLSILIGTFTVGGTYTLAREICPRQPGLAPLSAALVAFNPMFLFISGSVNNDNLAVALCTWGMVEIVRAVKYGPTVRRALGIGFICAAATLSKLSGLTLYPVAGIMLLAWGWRQRRWREALTAGAIIGALGLLVSGWWFWRNWQLYGDPTGLNMMAAIAGYRKHKPSLLELAGEFEGFRISYWGLFGGVNVMGPVWLYRLFDGLTAIAGIGMLKEIIHRWRLLDWEQKLFLVLLIAQIGLVFVGIVRWTQMTPASQGRLLFPAIGAISVLMAIGLRGCIPYKLQAAHPGLEKRIREGLIVCLALIAAWMPWGVITPAYSQPPCLTEADLPKADLSDKLQHVNVYYEDAIRLLAYTIDGNTSYHPNDQVTVTLYWQALRAMGADENYSLFLHLLGRNYTEVGKIDTYPGGGTYPTSMWKPHQIIVDRYRVRIAAEADAPTLLRLEVGWWKLGSGRHLAPRSAEGTPLGSVILPIGKIVPHCWPQAPSTVLAEVGGQIILRGWELEQWEKLSPSPCPPVPPSPCPPVSLSPGHPLTLTLIWEAQGEINGDYTVFVHLEDEAGQVYATGDAPPRSGDYLTSAWAPGEVIEDTHVIPVPEDIPPGQYRLLVGLYDLHTGERLPALAPDGSRFPLDAVPLGTVEVHDHGR